MNQYKLSDIVIQIAKSSFHKDELHEVFQDEFKKTLDYIYKKVDIIGPNNSVLRNPLNLDNSFPYPRDREISLSGQEMITGDYLIFDYTGHSEDMFIKELNSLEEIEDWITGGGGITNEFTTYQIPIVRGEVRHYHTTFTNEIDGQEYDFVKYVHDITEWNFDENREGEVLYEISNVKIHWID